MVEFTYRAGFLIGPGLRFKAACGRAGTSTQKHEGDGATPSGRLPLLRVLYRADRIKPPRCAVPIEPIAPRDAWCDDPADAAYNQQIRLPHLARHEPLWRDDPAYDIIGVLGWNVSPIIPQRGSAIFLHLATPGYAATAGCLALSLPDLQTALAAGLTSIEVA